jgi:hypothetical protein
LTPWSCVRSVWSIRTVLPAASKRDPVVDANLVLLSSSWEGALPVWLDYVPLATIATEPCQE